MRNPLTYYIPPSEDEEESSFQCRHIHVDGRRCGSPCLRNELFCYYHHTTRKPIAPNDLATRKARSVHFDLPNPDERSSIQSAIGEVLQRIAANEIDVKRAGLLLYGLQIASLNLPKANATARLEDPVEEITIDPTYGALAVPARIDENALKGKARHFFERLAREKAARQEAERQQAERREEVASPGAPSIIPTLQAVAEEPTSTSWAPSSQLPTSSLLPPTPCFLFPTSYFLLPNLGPLRFLSKSAILRCSVTKVPPGRVDPDPHRHPRSSGGNPEQHLIC
jgi:hypothetical protein